MIVEMAHFRAATPSESQEARGSLAWRVLTYPWKVINVAIGTFDMWRKGPNFLKWDMPLPERVFRWISLKMGFLPYKEFTHHRPNIMFDMNLFVDKKVSEAFFKVHRNGDLFEPTRSFMLLLDVLKKTFPASTLTEDDFILTCTAEKTKLYHSLFSPAMRGDGMRSVVAEEISQALSDWTERSKEDRYINVTQETRLIASRIIIKLLFGLQHNNPRLTESINHINGYILKMYTRSLTPEDQQKFEQALVDFREATNMVLTSGLEIPLFQGRELELTLPQKQGLIFASLFGGQETVASLLNYVIYQVAGDDKLQKELTTSDTEKLFLNAIQEFTPATGVGRKVRNDICLEYKFSHEATPRKKIFFKGQQLATSIAALAAKSLPSPTSFASWSPFGGGPHHCPGMLLAKAEITTLIDEIKKGYKLKLLPGCEKAEKIAYFTLMLDKDILVHFVRP